MKRRQPRSGPGRAGRRNAQGAWAGAALIALLAVSLPAATVWEEDFSGYADGTGLDGTGAIGDYPLADSKWTLSDPSGGLEAGSAADFIKTSLINGRMETQDTNQEVVWESESIDITGYRTVSISIDVAASAGMEDSDYINTYYRIPATTTDTVIATHTNSFTATNDTVSGLSGSTLRVVIRTRNNGASEQHYFDNVQVTGTPGLAVPTATAATATNATRFTANWTAIGPATGYRLDVATNAAFTPGGSDVLSEGFEGATWPPTGWTLNSVDQSSTYAHTGSESALCGAAGDTLITPLLVAPGSLTFWTYTSAANPDTWVESATDVAGPWSAVTGSPFQGVAETWNEWTVDLSGREGIYLRFRKDGSGNLYIDDVDVTDLGTGDFVAGYENTPVAGGGSTSLEITGLDLETTYYYRVRATNTTYVSSNSNTRTVQTTSLQAATAQAVTTKDDVSFTAEWTAVDGAAGYFLDVATEDDFTPSAGGDLIISELCDPSDDFATDRYIEIYNAGRIAADLTGWSVAAVGNGSEIFTWNLSGTLAAGDALTCGDTENTQFTPDVADNGWSDQNTSWNGTGGDGATLKNAAGTIVDDASTHNAFADAVSVRASETGFATNTFTASQWAETSVTTAGTGNSTPGAHTDDLPDPSVGDYVTGYEYRDVGDVTSISVTGLVALTSYSFRVRAYGDALGPWSNTQTVETAASPEPDTHVTDFSAGTPTHRTIVLTWTDAVGANLPDQLLIRGSRTSLAAIPDPVDGTEVANDSDWSDGTYVGKVDPGVGTLRLTDLRARTGYYFKIFPMANSAYPTQIDYKTDGTVPSVTPTTLTAPFEDFEDVTQTGYLTGDLALGSGTWAFTDALLGKTANDKRNDQQALRIREGGSVAFDATQGALSMSLQHAAFSADTSCRLRIYRSLDAGVTWAPVSNTVACASSYTNTQWTLDLYEPVRLMISNAVSTADHRINIDDVRVNAPPQGTVIRFY